MTRIHRGRAPAHPTMPTSGRPRPSRAAVAPPARSLRTSPARCSPGRGRPAGPGRALRGPATSMAATTMPSPTSSGFLGRRAPRAGSVARGALRQAVTARRVGERDHHRAPHARRCVLVYADISARSTSTRHHALAAVHTETAADTVMPGSLSVNVPARSSARRRRGRVGPRTRRPQGGGPPGPRRHGGCPCASAGSSRHCRMPRDVAASEPGVPATTVRIGVWWWPRSSASGGAVRIQPHSGSRR